MCTPASTYGIEMGLAWVIEKKKIPQLNLELIRRKFIYKQFTNMGIGA